MLEAWLKSENDWIAWNEAVFTVSRAGVRYHFLSAMPGVLREKVVAAGAEIGSEATVALIEAEGDEIPYGRPWGALLPA